MKTHCRTFDRFTAHRVLILILAAWTIGFAQKNASSEASSVSSRNAGGGLVRGESSTSEEITFRRLRFEYDSSRVFFDRGKRVGDAITVESVDTVKITG